MSEVNFPSGQWVGFYTYAKGGERYLMDLILEFRDGRISGEGADGIGLFVISGRYDAQTAECHWTKTYVGRHSVEYFGYREKKGIWGTWTIDWTKGGFHIWPIGESAPIEEVREEVEKELPPILVPDARPHNPLMPRATGAEGIGKARPMPRYP